MNDLMQPLTKIEMRSDGLWLYNGSILANFMGGSFPIESIDRYSTIVGNEGLLTFRQIVDFFDTWHSTKDAGIFTALFLSKYMGKQNVFESISDKLSYLVKDYPSKHQIQGKGCYNLAIHFRDGYANHLINIANMRFGSQPESAVHMNTSEAEQCKHLAILHLKDIIYKEIAKAGTISLSHPNFKTT